MNEAFYFENINFVEPMVTNSNILDELIDYNHDESILLRLIRDAKRPLIVRYKLHEDGRVYPIHHTSFGDIECDNTRNRILSQDWTSINLVNVHASILNQSISPRSSIVAYCNDRDRILSEVCEIYEVNQMQAKMLFIHLMQMKPFDTWANRFSKKNQSIQTPFIQQFISDMREVRNILQNISTFCNEIERTILRHMFDFCVQEQVIPFDHESKTAICILHHDTLYVMKKHQSDSIPLFIDRLSSHIDLNTGFKVQINIYE